MSKSNKDEVCHSLRIVLSLLSPVIIFLAGACHKPAPFSAEIENEWEKHEEVISSAIADEGFYEYDYYQALKFFRTLTGISIRSNLGYDGVMPNSYTESDLDRVRDWYHHNRDKLCWNPSERVVVLCSPERSGK